MALRTFSGRNELGRTARNHFLNRVSDAVRPIAFPVVVGRRSSSGGCHCGEDVIEDECVLNLRAEHDQLGVGFGADAVPGDQWKTSPVEQRSLAPSLYDITMSPC